MEIYTEKKDLFTVPHGFYFAHCISGDFALGAGIAKKFDEVYNMRYKLFYSYGNYSFNGHGEALLIDNVFNLVTKDKCYHKPTYDTVRQALEDMKGQCEYLHIDKLAMPKIASGLDRLEWNKVQEIIKEVFDDTDMSIMICEL